MSLGSDDFKKLNAQVSDRLKARIRAQTDSPLSLTTQ